MNKKQEIKRLTERNYDLNAELFYARRDRDDAYAEMQDALARQIAVQNDRDLAQVILDEVRRHALHSKDHARRRLDRIKELVR